MSYSKALEKFKENWPYIFTIVTIGLISRLPFLNAGFGIDNDGWRVVNAGNYWFETGVYMTSRVPCYPIHEFISGLLRNHDFFWHNAVVALHSIQLGVIVFLLVLSEANKRVALWSSLAVLFTATVWTNSIVNMDYIPAVTWVLTALWFSSKEKALMAGICIGIAAGFRLSSALYGLLFLIYNYNSLRLFVKSGLAGGLLFIAFYIIPFLTYKLGVLSYYPMKEFHNWDRYVFDDSIKQLGILAFFGLPVIIVIRIKSFLKNKITPLQLSLLLGMLICMVLFISVPIDPDYLIPFFVFIVIFICLRLPKFSILVFLLMLSSSCFFRLNTSFYYMYKAVEAKENPVSFVDLNGPFYYEYQKQLIQLTYLRKLESYLSQKNGYFIAGLLRSKAQYMFKDLKGMQVVFNPSRELVKERIKLGDKFYITPQMLEWLNNRKGTDLSGIGIKLTPSYEEFMKNYKDDEFLFSLD